VALALAAEREATGQEEKRMQRRLRGATWGKNSTLIQQQPILKGPRNTG
jgi:hypothetical protein